MKIIGGGLTGFGVKKMKSCKYRQEEQNQEEKCQNKEKIWKIKKKKGKRFKYGQNILQNSIGGKILKYGKKIYKIQRRGKIRKKWKGGKKRRMCGIK